MNKLTLTLITTLFLFTYIGVSNASASYHPADTSANWEVGDTEILSYLASWRAGNVTDAYVLNGLAMWKAGAYHYDPTKTSAPSWWVVGADPVSNLNPELQGFVPGLFEARQIVYDPISKLAYVASDEFGLSIIDISTPSNPKAIGGAIPSFYADHVAVSGPLALLSSLGFGLNVVDVSNPYLPKTVGHFDGSYSGVAISGRYGYAFHWVSGNPGHYDLEVLDLGTPSAPVILGHVTLSGATEMNVVGSLVYVGAGTFGLQIIDVSQPDQPRILTTVDSPGSVRDVEIVNGIAYVADQNYLTIINVNNPITSSIVGSVAMAGMKISVAGTRAFMINGGLLNIADITTPSQPILLASTDIMYGSSYSSFYDIATKGNLVMLTSPINDVRGGLLIYDASIPTTPSLLSQVNTMIASTGFAVDGSLAVIAAQSAGMKILDVRDVYAPKVVGTFKVASNETINSVSISGRYAYTGIWVSGNPGHYDFGVVDLEYPDFPKIVGRMTPAGFNSIKIAGGFAYLVSNTIGLQIVDVRTPTQPQVVSTVDTPGSARSVEIANGYAYVADNTDFVVINISNPMSPFIVQTINTVSLSIALSGTRGYLMDTNYLKIFDLINPSQPSQLNSISLAPYGGPQGLAVIGNELFLVSPGLIHSSTDGIHVLDVSDATQPRYIKRIMVPGNVRNILASGNMIYVADPVSLIDIIRP